jgi:sugar phosphate isomerase/epimerase
MEQRQEGRALIADHGLALAVHAPFNSINIAAINPGIRAESVKQQKDAIELCSDLGGRAVVVHNGEYIVSPNIRKKVPGVERLQWDYNVQSIREIAAFAREQGVMVCLENIGFEPDHMDHCVADLIRIKQEVDEPALAFCIDIGHARLNNELPEAIEKMGPFTGHIHFTDNLGKKDDHLIIGEGDFDYSPLRDFIRDFQHLITLEVVRIGADPAPAITSKRNFEKIMGIA